MKRKELEGHLLAAGVEAEVFAGEGGGEILVTRHGGRVLGAFASGGGENIFYVDAVMFDAASARKHLKGEHILGGDRVWIAPERGLFFKGDRLEDGVVTQKAIDPGEWREKGRMEGGGGGVKWVNDFVAEYFHVAGAVVKGQVMRGVRVIGSPVGVPMGVGFVGYEVGSWLMLLDAPEGLWVGMWFLIQFLVPVGGYVFVPTCGRGVITDYYEPAGGDYLRVEENYVRFKADSIDRHKIGVRKNEVMGRMGFLSNAREGGMATLIVRNFLNDPSASYADVPLHTPAGTQDSVQAYNHYSGPSGFAEIEFHAPGVRMGGERMVMDVNQVWVFEGKREELVGIAAKLLYLPERVFAV